MYSRGGSYKGRNTKRWGHGDLHTWMERSPYLDGEDVKKKRKEKKYWKTPIGWYNVRD